MNPARAFIYMFVHARWCLVFAVTGLAQLAIYGLGRQIPEKVLVDDPEQRVEAALDLNGGEVANILAVLILVLVIAALTATVIAAYVSHVMERLALDEGDEPLLSRIDPAWIVPRMLRLALIVVITYIAVGLATFVALLLSESGRAAFMDESTSTPGWFEAIDLGTDAVVWLIVLLVAAGRWVKGALGPFGGNPDALTLVKSNPVEWIAAAVMPVLIQWSLGECLRVFREGGSLSTPVFSLLSELVSVYSILVAFHLAGQAYRGSVASIRGEPSVTRGQTELQSS